MSALVTPEGYADNATTTVAGGGYTAGSGVLNVASTAGSFPASNQFHFYISDATTGAVKAIGKATAVNSATQWAVTMTLDANASSGDSVVLSLCAAAMDQIRADMSQVGTGAVPTTSQNGDQYNVTDDLVTWKRNASAFVPFGPIFALTDPTVNTFAWRNQGSATLTSRTGSLTINAPALAADSEKVREKTAPATPWTVTALLLPQLHKQSFNQCGVCVRDSVGGKLVLFGIQAVTASYPTQMIVSYWTNETTFSTQPYNFDIVPTQWIWLRIGDDGVNLTFAWSMNGFDFISLTSLARHAFLAAGPDKVGFYVGASNATYPCSNTLLSWKEA